MLFYFLFLIAFLPCLIIYPRKVIGKKKLKQLKGKNFIISCNHMSNHDIVVLDLVFGKKLYVLAKKELFKSKFKAWFLKAMGGVPVDRQNTDISAIKSTLKLLSKNKNVCIFPQGTRCKQPEILEGSAKEGVAMFAVRTSTPVVPIMFIQKAKAFRRSKLIIGEPIYPDETKKKDKNYIDEFSNTIVGKMNDLLKGENKNENEGL